MTLLHCTYIYISNRSKPGASLTNISGTGKGGRRERQQRTEWAQKRPRNIDVDPARYMYVTVGPVVSAHECLSFKGDFDGEGCLHEDPSG